MIAPVPAPMIPRPFRIERLTKETTDTFTWQLRPLDEGAFAFEPGQFNMLYAWGIGEVPISISGDATHTDHLTHTIRAVGSVTMAMQKLRRGDVVGVRGPYGTPWPIADVTGKDILIITGGIGLAPLRPVMYHILHHRDRYGRVLMLYGARSPADMLYAKELEKWRGRFDMHVSVTVDHADRSWRGNVGVVTTLLPKFNLDEEMTFAMVCGPEIMMRFTIQSLLQRGVAPENVYVSMERNMKCGIGLCGHCQFGPHFICKDGAVFRYDRVRPLMLRREL